MGVRERHEEMKSMRRQLDSLCKSETPISLSQQTPCLNQIPDCRVKYVELSPGRSEAASALGEDLVFQGVPPGLMLAVPTLKPPGLDPESINVATDINNGLEWYSASTEANEGEPRQCDCIATIPCSRNSATEAHACSHHERYSSKEQGLVPQNGQRDSQSNRKAHPS